MKGNATEMTTFYVRITIMVITERLQRGVGDSENPRDSLSPRDSGDGKDRGTAVWCGGQ